MEAEPALQTPVQQAAAADGRKSQETQNAPENRGDLLAVAANGDHMQECAVPALGPNTSAISRRNRDVVEESAAPHYDATLANVVEAWPRLPKAVKKSIALLCRKTRRGKTMEQRRSPP